MGWNRRRRLIRSVFAGAMAGGGISYTIPQNLILTEGTLLEDFENAGDWTVANGAVEQDTVNFVSGSKSIKVTGNAGVSCTVTKDVSWDLSSSDLNRDFRLAYYCYDDPPSSKCNGIYITLYSTTNLARYYQVVVYPVHYGWNYFHMRLSDWTQTGVDTWANPRVKMRITVSSASGQQAVISFDEFIAGRISQPAVLITFDDGGSSIYSTAYNIMRQYGLVGTAYLITSAISPGDYAPLYNAGWDLGNHTHDHISLTTLSQGDAQTQLSTAKAALDGWGYTRASSHVAYPYGVSNATVRAAMAAEGMLSGRNVTTLANSLQLNPHRAAYFLPGLVVGDPSISLATAKGYIDTLKAREECKIFLFHSLVESSPAANQWTIADFTDLMAYIRAQNVRSLTASELYNLQSGNISIRHA